MKGGNKTYEDMTTASKGTIAFKVVDVEKQLLEYIDFDTYVNLVNLNDHSCPKFDKLI